MMQRPLPTEFESTYLQYYIDLVSGNNVVEFMEKQIQAHTRVFKLITEEQSNKTYQEGKWTIKEVLGHMVDTERIFANRACCISRGDKTNQPGYEQDDYVLGAEFNTRSWNSLIQEYHHLRMSNIYLFGNIQANAWSQKGSANGKAITTRAIVYALAGHAEHHFNVIRTKYLS